MKLFSPESQVVQQFLLYIEAREGIRRKSNQQELDRLEGEDISFHETVCSGFKELSQRHKDRITFIDAARSIEEIQKEITSHMSNLLK